MLAASGVSVCTPLETSFIAYSGLGADVAEHDAQRAKGQSGESGVARRSSGSGASGG